jgi:hypothetical protein
MIGLQQIQRCNEVLRDLDALFPDSDTVHQKFMWKWSTDLFDVVPKFDVDGNPAYKYVCDCGTDIQVHFPHCKGILRAITVTEKMCLVDPMGPYASYPNMWMLCRWQSPELLCDWVERFGTEVDYPKNGSYRPVSRGPVCVVIPPRTAPGLFFDVTLKVMQMMREHSAKLKAELAKSAEAPPLEVPIYDQKGVMTDAPPANAEFWKLKDRLKDVMRRYNPASTVGYGGKSKDFQVNHSDRSLADYGSPLQRQRAQEKVEMTQEIQKEVAREIPL